METQFELDMDFINSVFLGGDTQQEVEHKKSAYEKMVERDIKRNEALYAEELKEDDDYEYSFNVEVPSRKGGTLTYVRLSAERHEALRDILNGIMTGKAHWRSELARKSGLYGERIGKPSTYLHLVEGMLERMGERHPNVKGRIGLDCSMPQMEALDRLLTMICDTAFDRGYKPEVTSE